MGIRSYKRLRKEKRQTQKGIEDAVSFYMDMTVGEYLQFAAVVVAVNLIVGALPNKYTVWDLTTNKLYSLTQDSIDYVSDLDEDVTIYVLNTEDHTDSMVK